MPNLDNLKFMKNAKTKELSIEMRAQGLNYQHIANDLGISKQTALNWAKKLDIEIHNLKTLELDALYQKHYLSTKSRIELFGEQLTKIKEELAKRKLNDLSMEKLFFLMIKFTETIAAERTSLQFREKQSLLGLPDNDSRS